MSDRLTPGTGADAPKALLAPAAGYRIPQAIFVVVRLDIADRLRDGP